MSAEPSEVRTQFEERIGRAVARFLDHADKEGLDADELDGEFTLRFSTGLLADISFTPAAVRRAAKPGRGRVGEKRTAATADDLPELDQAAKQAGHFADE